jgi:hypothetical protein
VVVGREVWIGRSAIVIRSITIGDGTTVGRMRSSLAISLQVRPRPKSRNPDPQTVGLGRKRRFRRVRGKSLIGASYVLVVGSL